MFVKEYWNWHWKERNGSRSRQRNTWSFQTGPATALADASRSSWETAALQSHHCWAEMPRLSLTTGYGLPQKKHDLGQGDSPQLRPSGDDNSLHIQTSGDTIQLLTERTWWRWGGSSHFIRDLYPCRFSSRLFDAPSSASRKLYPTLSSLVVTNLTGVTQVGSVGNLEPGAQTGNSFPQDYVPLQCPSSY